MEEKDQPVNATPNRADSIADDSQMDWLLEEYKIVQTKIDKLGEDMFKVRSWCITLFTGVAAGAKLSGGLSSGIICLLLPIVFAFQIVEYRQRQISRRAVKRGRNIEAAFRHWMRKAKLKTAFAPCLATQLLADGVNDKKNCTIRGWLKGKIKSLSKKETQPKEEAVAGADNKTESDPENRDERPKKSPTLGQCLVAQADFLFYGAQYLIIILLFAGTCLAAKKSEASFSLQFGTNSISFTSAVTNMVATNYVYQTRLTTNFTVKELYTTNFVVVTIPITNFVVATTNQNPKSRN